MTRILLGAIGALLLLVIALAGYGWWQTRSAAQAAQAVDEAVRANEALLQANHAWQKELEQRDRLLVDNRRTHHALNQENSRLQRRLREAGAGDICGPARPPAPLLRLFTQGGDEGGTGAGVPAGKPD